MKAIVLDYTNGNVLIIHLDENIEGEIEERVSGILEDENVNSGECCYMILNTDEFGNFAVEELYE